MTELCVYCGAKYGGGYCYQSPNGSHLMDDAGPDYVDPDNCCHECGCELSQAELNGDFDHVCDPGRVAAYKAYLASDDEDAEWDYRA